MSKERISWSTKGVWYEACASEGHCSLYFGRDLESPCKSFQLFQFTEGKFGDVDISDVLAINVIDLYSKKAADAMVKGGEGGVYISDKTTEEQRRYLEPYFVNNVSGGSILRKSLGVKYVDIQFDQEGDTFHVRMPFGEMKLSYTPGLDGKNPQRLENSPFGVFFSDLKICNTHFWKYKDFGRDWSFVNRSGVIANFDLKGKSRNF
ncbi:MAG: DUF1326 domain-containing protein [Promethearchaeota archaeon]|jgi:hypothetical protein